MSNGCVSLLNTTKNAYTQTLSILLNVSAGYISFSTCVDDNSFLRSRRLLSPSASSTYTGSVLSTKVTIPLYLFAVRKVSNQTQDAFGHSIYRYLGSICAVAVESGKFSLVFKSLLVNSSANANSQLLVFLNASTSSYMFTITSDGPTKTPSSSSNSNSATVSFIVIFVIAAGGAILLVLLLVGYYLGFFDDLRRRIKASSASESDASIDSNKRGKLKGKIVPTDDPSSKYKVSSTHDMEAGFAELYRAPPPDGDEPNPMGQQSVVNYTKDSDFQFSLGEEQPKKYKVTQSGAASGTTESNILEESFNDSDLTRQKYRVKKKRVVSKQALKIQEALRKDFPTTGNGNGDDNDDDQARKTLPTKKRKVIKRRL